MTDTNQNNQTEPKPGEGTDGKTTPPANTTPANEPPAGGDTTPPANQTPADDKPKEFDREVWGDPGDEVAESVYQVLSDSGVSPTDAKALLFDAVKAGDPSKIDKEALIEKVGKHQANLILAGVTNYISKENARVETAVKAVHTAAGGEKNWDIVKVWVGKNVPEADLAEYRDMIDAGGKKATLAVQSLVSLYNADPKNTALGKEEVRGDNTPAPLGNKGISQREYGDRLSKLYATNKATPEARAALLAERKAGKARGI